MAACSTRLIRIRSEKWLRASACGAALALSASGIHAEESASNRHARLDFDQGVLLAANGHLEEALAKFRVAYKARPHFGVLFNIGQTLMTLARPAEAVSAFEAYLRDGGEKVPVARRHHVEELIAINRGRIAHVVFEITPASALVTVDGRDIALAAAAEPISLAAGEHGVYVTAPGHVPQYRSLKLVAGKTARLVVELDRQALAEHSQLRVNCPIPGVLVSVGEIRKMTPLTEPVVVPVGSTEVRFSRHGYEPRKVALTVAGGQVTRVSCDLVPTVEGLRTGGKIRLVAHPNDSRVWVDGSPYVGHALPIGPHSVRVARTNYVSWEHVVTIEPRSERLLLATLAPTPTQRRAREERLARRRWWSLGVGAAGLGLVGGAIGTYIWNSSRYDDWQAERDDLAADLRGGMHSDATLERTWNLADNGARIRHADHLAVGMAVLGGVALATSAVLFFGE